MRRLILLMMRILFRFLPVIGLAFLAACAAPVSSPATLPPHAFIVATTPAPSSTPSQAPSATASATPTSLQATATPEARLCSPFPGYDRAQLIQAISNPFRPPVRPGSDDPHQAVDLAVTEYGMAVEGGPVHLMLDGWVAAVIRERFPYGNALMVETPLEALPEEWLVQIEAPTPAPTLGPHPSLNCPQFDIPAEWDHGTRSLYLLYAHMGDTPDFQLGENLECDTLIGVIGHSGNALNPHLHLEARIGPGNARFDGMAHYETRATPMEMWSYCTWRVSNLFQLVDPTNLLNLVGIAED